MSDTGNAPLAAAAANPGGPDAADRALLDAVSRNLAHAASLSGSVDSAGGAGGSGGADGAAARASVPAAAAAYAATLGLDAEMVRGLYALLRAPSAAARQTQPDAAAEGSALARAARRIDHVAIAVRDLEPAIAELRQRYGFEVIERRRVDGDVSGMDSATMRAGGVTLVVCQGTSPLSNVSRYIDAYGPGVQHLAIEVDREAEVIDDLKARGASLLTDIIHGPGLDQSFTRRDSNTGMQFEFVSRTDHAGFDDENVRKLFAAMERENVF